MREREMDDKTQREIDKIERERDDTIQREMIRGKEIASWLSVIQSREPRE